MKLPIRETREIRDAARAHAIILLAETYAGLEQNRVRRLAALNLNASLPGFIDTQLKPRLRDEMGVRGRLIHSPVVEEWLWSVWIGERRRK